MDNLLKKLNINDNDDGNKQTSSSPAPSNATIQQHQRHDGESLLDKIGHAMTDRNDQPTLTQQPPTATSQGHKSVFDKIGDALQGGNEAHAVAPVVVAAPQERNETSVFDKIGDALGGGSRHDHPSPPAPTSAPPKEGSLFDKIGDALSGGEPHRDHRPPPPSAPPKEEHLVDKIGSILGGGHPHSAQPPPPPPPPESLFERISDTLSGHRAEQQQPQPQGNEGILGKIGEAMGHGRREPERPESLGDKINSVFGGGSRAEEKEGKLDKTIDFVQEHVLKEGQQKNETAFEQLKDKRIADAIRHVTGSNSR